MQKLDFGDTNVPNHLKIISEMFFQNRFLKGIFLIFSLGMICCLLYGVYFFSEVRYKVEIDLISDHASVSQLFWRTDNERYSEQASLRLGIKPGDNHLVFALPLSARTQLKQLRFDPTEKDKGTFEITRIRYINGRKGVYHLPVIRLSKTPSNGISFTDISEKKVRMVSQNRDPSIIIKIQDFEKSGSLSKTTPYMILLILSLIVWIAGLHGMQGVLGDIYPNLYKVVPILAKVMYSILFVLLVCYLCCTTALLGKVTCALLLLYGIKYLCFREWKKEKKPEVVRTHFDYGMHYFRAIAIICICLGHIIHWERFHSLGRCLFEADSIYFLFISGFLAQYLFFKKPDAPLLYYKKKVINVISPYIFLSLAILVWRYFDHSPVTSVWSENYTLKNILIALCLGQAIIVYWYIPFVSVLFLFTPLFVRFSQKNFKNILFMFFALAVIFPQRGREFNGIEQTIYMFTYFTFSYLFGMAFCRYRDLLEPCFKKLFWPAVILAFGIAALIFWEKDLKIIVSSTSLLCSLQKILFIICFIPLLGYIKNVRITWLSNIAEYSFTLFFIHWIFIEDFRKICSSALSYVNLPLVVMTIGIGCLYIAYLLFLSILLKKIFGKYSRYFIGS